MVNWVMSTAIAARVGLLAFGIFQDYFMDVKYTDMDYFVFTDAAARTLEGSTPYARHTFRYSPIIAYLMVPNLLAFAEWGKLIFIAFDLLAGVLLEKLQEGSGKYWLLNPLVINMSTRGSSESIIASLLILTLYLLKKQRYTLAGIFFGLAVHLRIYPIIYALSFYLYTDKHSTTFITKNRLKLGFTAAGVFFGLIGLFYYLYGYQFLFETYIFHFARKDNRHNFSVYFYLLYLTFHTSAKLVGLMAFIPQWFANLYISYRKSQIDIALTLVTQTIVFVMFNKVMTAQYFIWVMTWIPLIISRVNISKKQAAAVIAIWVLSEWHWLFWGYHLEFLGQNVFLQLWFASLIFFIATLILIIVLLRSTEKLHKD